MNSRVAIFVSAAAILVGCTASAKSATPTTQLSSSGASVGISPLPGAPPSTQAPDPSAPDPSAPESSLPESSVPSPTTAAPVTNSVVSLATCVSTWSLRDRIALLVWPAVYSNQWSYAQQTVRDLHIGGVILMKPSDTFAASLRRHLDDLKAISAHGLLVATDEEGGAVQRLKALGAIPSEQDMSAMDPAQITSILTKHAKVVADAGIDVIFGPVVDVRPLVGSDPLGEGRLFVGGPTQVAALATLYVTSWESAGLLPVLKHFPGHGSASADTHQQLATTPPLAELRQRDFVPYQQLAAAGTGVMVGHLAVPDLTGGAPASQSPAAISLLRGELAYGDALVFSDALGMGAVGASVPTASVRAIAAGIDVVIFTGTADTAPVIDSIDQAVRDGRLNVARIDDAATRVAGVLAAHGTPCVPTP